MSYQPQYTITPALLGRIEQIAALRERILAATVQVRWIPALQKDTNTIRPTQLVYPSSTTSLTGRVLYYDYGSSEGMNDLLSRVKSLIDADGTTHLADYTYMGLNPIAQVSAAQPGTELTYIKQGSEPVGDGGDQYTGWDRFGRLIDQRWIQISSGTAFERTQYGYNQASNRLWRANLVAEAMSANQDEHYTYDGLYQLKTLQRGTLNGTRTGITGTPTWKEDFTFDPTGNWTNYVTEVSGSITLNQPRTHNKANEIEAISGSSSLIQENAAGNITKAPLPFNWSSVVNMTYDAWNRLVQASTTSYSYDGLDRRVNKIVASTTRRFFYSAQWQILEERTGSSSGADRQFVWGLMSLDNLVLRDRGLTRLYAFSDYWNCTGMTNVSGAVQERYGYNAFGQPRFMTPSFTTVSASSADWETLYCCYRWDSETGLYQARYRYLHPTLGRWITRDPKEYINGLNLYMYVKNTPINFTDPYGLESVDTCNKDLKTLLRTNRKAKKELANLKSHHCPDPKPTCTDCSKPGSPCPSTAGACTDPITGQVYICAGNTNNAQTLRACFENGFRQLLPGVGA